MTDPDQRSQRPEAAPYIAALLLTLAFYSPWFLPKAVLWMGDYQHLFVPTRAYATCCLQNLRLPQWVDLLHGGYPFLCDPQTAVFSPLNLAFAALSPHPSQFSIDCLSLACVLGIGMGGVFLARSMGISRTGAVATAVIVTFNGFMLSHLGQTAIGQTACAGIWALGALARALKLPSRTWAVSAGLLFASMILGGHPHTGLLFVYAAVALTLATVVGELAQGRLRKFASSAAANVSLACIVAAGGALVQILPTHDLLANSSRSFGQMTEQMAVSCSLPPRQIWGLLFPGLYEPLLWRVPPDERFLIPYDLGGETLYALGLFAVALALLGWLANLRRIQVQFLFAGIVILLLGSLGQSGFIYPLLYRCAPGFGNVRFPMRLLLVAYIGVGLLAGLGVDAVSKAPVRRVRRAAAVAVAILALIMLSGAATIVATAIRTGSCDAAFSKLFIDGCPFQHWRQRAPTGLVACVFDQLLIGVIVLAGATAWLLTAWKLDNPGRALRFIAVAGVFLELGICGFHKNIRIGPPKYDVFDYSMYRAVSSDAYACWHSGRVDCPGRAGNRPGRVLAIDPITHPAKNSALMAGVPYAGGLQPIVLNWVAPFLPPETFAFGQDPAGKLLTLWNVSRLVCPRDGFEAETDGLRIRRKSRALQAPQVENRDEETTASADTHVAYETLGVLPKESGSPDWLLLERPAAPGYSWLVPTAEAVPYGPHFAEIKARLLRDDFDPCVRVLLDEAQAADILVHRFNASNPQAFRGSVFRQVGSAGAFSVECEADQSGWLVLSSVWHHGWRVKVDGSSAPLLRADGPMSCVPVPAGRHEVAFAFETPGLRLGAFVSAVTWCGALLYLLLRSLERRYWCREARSPMARPRIS